MPGLCSESVLGGLCREAARLRNRADQVGRDLERCRHPGLCQRLQHELEGLGRRRCELQRLSVQLRAAAVSPDSLAFALLDELCRRPWACS